MTRQGSTALGSLLLMAMSWITHCEIYVPLQWNPLNPVFQASSDKKNGSAVLHFNVLPMSKINIICPNTVENPVKLDKIPSKKNLFENLWIVDKLSYDTCVVNTTLTKNYLLHKCNDPTKLKYYPLVFLLTAANIEQPEFKKGEEYYFIGTSNGSESSLDKTELGHCHSHNMKFMIHVCYDASDPLCADRDLNPNKKVTVSPPTNRKSETPAGSPAKEARCFIPSADKIWLISVSVVVAVLIISLVMCSIFLCCRRRSSKQTVTNEKDANLLLKKKKSNLNV